MKRPLLHSGVLLLALGAALLGQFLLPQQVYTWSGAAYFALAVVAFLWVLQKQPSLAHGIDAPDEAGTTAVAHPAPTLPWPLRIGLAGATVGLALFAYSRLSHNTFTQAGVLAWLGAIFCFLLLFWPGTAAWPGKVWAWSRKRPFPSSTTLTITRHHLILLAILLLAAFFRFYRLDSLPAEMGSDQAEKLFDVYDVLERDLRPIFFPRNTGREAAQFYLTAGIIKLTGLPLGFLPLKLGTALVGLFAVPWVYLLARELYGRAVAYLTTTLFALSAWHVVISRLGLRFPFTPAFATATLYYFFRALKHNRRNDWLAAGLFLGVGLHTYIPMRIMPLLLVLLIMLKLLLDSLPIIGKWFFSARRQETHTNNLKAAVTRSPYTVIRWLFPEVVPRGSPITDYRLRTFGTTDDELPGAYREASALTWSFWQNALLSGLVSLLLFLPLLRYMRDDPGMFWLRVTSRSLENGALLPGEAWRTFWSNVKNALLMFNYRGDAVVSNSIPFTPFLGLISGALFVLGLAYLLWRLVRYRDRRTLYVLVTLFVLLLPSILSLEFPKENPSRVRSGGAIPWAMLIAALPLWVLGQQLRANWARAGKWVAAGVTAVLLIVAFHENYVYYFVRYDAHFQRTLWNTSEIGDVARGFAASAGDMSHVYHVPYPFWVDTRLIGIYAGAIPWENAVLDTAHIAQQHAPDPAPKLYILYPNDTAVLSLLQATYPTGWVELYESRYGKEKNFLLFFVPPRG